MRIALASLIILVSAAALAQSIGGMSGIYSRGTGGGGGGGGGGSCSGVIDLSQGCALPMLGGL